VKRCEPRARCVSSLMNPVSDEALQAILDTRDSPRAAEIAKGGALSLSKTRTRDDASRSVPTDVVRVRGSGRRGARSRGPRSPIATRRARHSASAGVRGKGRRHTGGLLPNTSTRYPSCWWCWSTCARSRRSTVISIAKLRRGSLHLPFVWSLLLAAHEEDSACPHDRVGQKRNRGVSLARRSR